MGLALHGPYIYWANYGAPNASAGGDSIGRARRNGTEVNDSFVVGLDSPGYLAVAASN